MPTVAAGVPLVVLSGPLTSPAPPAPSPPVRAVAVGSYTIVASPNDPDGRLGTYQVTITNGVLTVTKASQSILWANPTALLQVTPLGGKQLNATVSVVGPSPAGALTYYPEAGTILPVGVHTLRVTAVATENYDAAVAEVYLQVLKPYSLSGFVFADFDNNGEIGSANPASAGCGSLSRGRTT